MIDIGTMVGRGNSVDVSQHHRPSIAVIEAVAEVEGIAPEELCPPDYEPLHEIIDPEALDNLFAPRQNDQPRIGGSVRFRFCDYDITVHSDGEITVD